MVLVPGEVEAFHAHCLVVVRLNQLSCSGFQRHRWIEAVDVPCACAWNFRRAIRSEYPEVSIESAVLLEHEDDVLNRMLRNRGLSHAHDNLLRELCAARIGSCRRVSGGYSSGYFDHSVR